MMFRKLAFALTVLSGCGGAPATEVTGPAAGRASGLQAACAGDAASAPNGAWICGDDRTVECTGPTTRVDSIFVLDAATPTHVACDGVQPAVDQSGPFAVGTHVVRVSDRGTPLCESELRVVDTTPPEVTPRAIDAWPPNHKMRAISIADCVTVRDTCDPNVRVTFTHAESDEPVDATGDGHSSPDIVVGCDRVEVRAERSGNQDGRRYTLGWRAVDASGNEAEGTCTVTVAHDQSGRPAVAGPAVVRVDAPASCAGPS